MKAQKMKLLAVVRIANLLRQITFENPSRKITFVIQTNSDKRKTNNVISRKQISSENCVPSIKLAKALQLNQKLIDVHLNLFLPLDEPPLSSYLKATKKTARGPKTPTNFYLGNRWGNQIIRQPFK